MVLTQSARQRLQSGNLGDRARAIAALHEAVAASPEFADAHLQLGRAILETGGDALEAVSEFRRVLNLDPERAEAHYQIGLALLKTDERAALKELRAAADMAPCREEIMRALGQTALDAQDWSTAIAQFRHLLAWAPADRDARAQLDRALAEQKRNH